MIQQNIFSFLSGALLATVVLVNFYFYGPFVVRSLHSFQQASVVPAPVPRWQHVPPVLIAPDVQAFLASYKYVPFEESPMVLRKGDVAIEAPQPRYTDKDYLDIDLERKAVTLFSSGKPQIMYEVMAYGNPWNSPTPKGEFSIKTKEEKHFSRKVGLWMPWAMQVQGDYFLHGWPYYPDGTLYKGNYSRGCVRIPTDQIANLFGRIALGTPVVIY